MREALNSPLLGNPISSIVAADVHAILGRFPKARYPVGIDAKVYYLSMSLKLGPSWSGAFCVLFLLFLFLVLVQFQRSQHSDLNF